MGHPDPVKPLAAALMTVRASPGTAGLRGGRSLPLTNADPLPASSAGHMGLFYPLTCLKPDQGKKMGVGVVSNVFFIPWKIWAPF